MFRPTLSVSLHLLCDDIYRISPSARTCHVTGSFYFCTIPVPIRNIMAGFKHTHYMALHLLYISFNLRYTRICKDEHNRSTTVRHTTRDTKSLVPSYHLRHSCMLRTTLTDKRLTAQERRTIDNVYIRIEKLYLQN